MRLALGQRPVVADDEHGQVAPVAITAEREARVGNGLQLLLDLLLPLLLAELALLGGHQRHGQLRIAHLAVVVGADRLDDRGDLRALAEHRRRLGADSRGVLDTHAGRQFDTDVGPAGVFRRQEFGRQQRGENHDGAKEDQTAGRHRRPAMPDAGRQCPLVPEHQRPVFLLVDVIRAQRVGGDDRRD